MGKMRLEVLAESLGVPTSEIQTRESLMGNNVDLNCTEFVVKDHWYNVLKEEEVEGRLSELLNDCYKAEALQEAYDTTDADVAAQSADINIYLSEIDVRDNFIIYQAC